MSKPASRIAIAAVVLVLVVAVVAGVLLGQLGRLIEHGVETVGPTITGTPVTLGNASISIFSGEGALKRLRIANPEGYSTPYAFDLGQIAVAVDTKTVTGDVIHIRSVVIDGPKLVAEFDAEGRNNLKAILDHVNALAQKAPGRSQPKGGSSDGAQTKMIIDEFRFVNAEVRAVAEPFQLDKTLKLRTIELKNLGGKGGAAASDIANQILHPIVDAAIKAARDEYVAAKRGELEQKAKEKSRELLDKVFK